MSAAFIQTERQQLDKVVGEMSQRQKRLLMPRVKRIKKLLKLLQKRGKSESSDKLPQKIRQENDQVALSSSLIKGVTRAAVRHGHAQSIADRLSYEEGSEPVAVSTNLYGDNTAERSQSSFTSENFEPNPFVENTTPEIDIEGSSLSQTEVDEIRGATRDTRRNIIKQYESETTEAIDKYNSNSDNISKTTAGGIGLFSGVVAQKTVDYLDPKQKIAETPRAAAVGGLGSILAETGASLLGSTPEYLTSGVAGALGGVAAESEYKKLKQEGTDEFTAQVDSGAVGGGTFGATTSAPSLFGAIIGGAETGAETGGLGAVETAGLSVGGGAVAGAILAGSAYEISKAYHNIMGR
jgi:hypothetical protein